MFWGSGLSIVVDFRHSWGRKEAYLHGHMYLAVHNLVEPHTQFIIHNIALTSEKDDLL